MSSAPVPSPAAGRSTSLRTGHIVYLIVSAAAPLSAMVGTVPLAFALGNGAGVPAAFAFAGLTLLCFSVGYALIARNTGGSGGFYAAVAAGLGRPPAVAGGYVALLAYNCATIGLVGALGYFVRLVLASHGIHVPWELCAGIGVALMAVLGYREIGLSARTVAVLMLGEIGILAVLDVAVIVRHGLAALPGVSFTPHQALGHGVGVSVMFAFVSFIGFESAALYGREAKDPRRSVPRATYTAVLLISVFYAVTSWVAVGAVGSGKVRGAATAELGDLFFDIGRQYLGSVGNAVMQVLLCTSLFAAVVALHSAANRYAQVLGEDGLLPRRLGVVHSVHGSPHRASVIQTALCAAAVVGFGVAGLDPYTGMTTSMLGLGTLGIVVLQATAALSVLGLRRQGRTAGLWRGIIAPLLGFAGLAATVVLAMNNFSLLSGSTSAVVAALPWLLVPTILGGVAYAWWLRARRPDRYRNIAAVHLAGEPAPSPAPVVARQGVG
jgi:amino acid transporter